MVSTLWVFLHFFFPKLVLDCPYIWFDIVDKSNAYIFKECLLELCS